MSEFFVLTTLIGDRSGYSVTHNSIAISKELCTQVCTKMALGEVDMPLPHPCPSASRLLRIFFKSHNFFIMEKLPVSEEF